MKDEKYYMNKAIEQAKKAYKIDEIPIGAIIVKNDKVIGKGYNTRNSKKDPLGHAELIAIQKASKRVGDWRLEDCVMYVTVEPCPMCAGAIVQSRMKKVIYGCDNSKAGSCGSIVNLLEQDEFNHKVECEKGVLQAECSSLMSDFFKKLRNERKRLVKNTKKV